MGSGFFSGLLGEEVKNEREVGSMEFLIFVVTIEILTGFAGFMLGRAVTKHDNRCNQAALRDDSDMRTYVFKRDRSRGSDNRRVIQVDEEGRKIK